MLLLFLLLLMLVTPGRWVGWGQEGGSVYGTCLLVKLVVSWWINNYNGEESETWRGRLVWELKKVPVTTVHSASHSPQINPCIHFWVSFRCFYSFKIPFFDLIANLKTWTIKEYRTWYCWTMPCYSSSYQST